MSNFNDDAINSDKNNLLLEILDEGKMRENHETQEITECAMGPIWKQTYHILVELFKDLIPEPVIREMLNFHAAIPPVTDFVDRLTFVRNPNFGYYHTSSILDPQCYNCHAFIEHLSMVYIATKPCNKYYPCYCGTTKIRLVCRKCMPESLIQFVDKQFETPLKLESEAKFGPGLIPLNNKAHVVSLCIDENWRFSKGTVTMTNESSTKRVCHIMIDMHGIVRSFDIGDNIRDLFNY